MRFSGFIEVYEYRATISQCSFENYNIANIAKSLSEINLTETFFIQMSFVDNRQPSDNTRIPSADFARSNSSVDIP